MSRRDGSLDVTKAQGQTKSQVRVGDEFEVTPLAIVHGGHGIAHAAGRTIFVRFAIPGELVRIRVTDVNSKACRAEVVEVLAPSALRRSAPCAVFGPGGCGGCDFLHVDAPTQRSWKTEVLIESLARFAGVDVHRQFPGLHVAPLDDGDGLGWRTRIRWSAVGTTWGLHRYRSSQVVPIASCPQAVPAIAAAPQRTGDQAIAWSSADSAVTQVIDGRVVQGGSKVAVEAAGRHWRIRATGFWQVHPKLADVLADAVRQSGATSASGTWWDLYAGAGLFAWVLAAAGAEHVHAVESSPISVGDARRNLHDLPQIRVHHESVDRWLSGESAEHRATSAAVDGVVLDPPRAGAGAQVVQAICAANPETVIYIACDPVALARDLATFFQHGYRLVGLESWDSFPMTHHFETVATLKPDPGGLPIS